MSKYLLDSLSRYCRSFNSNFFHATTGSVTRVIYTQNPIQMNQDILDELTRDYPKIIPRYFKFDDYFISSLPNQFNASLYFSNKINDKFSSLNIEQFQNKLFENEKYMLLFFDNFDNLYRYLNKSCHEIVNFSRSITGYPSCRIGIILVCPEELKSLLNIGARNSKILRETYPLVNIVQNLNLQKYSQL
jgi:hypothetical protein